MCMVYIYILKRLTVYPVFLVLCYSCHKLGQGYVVLTSNVIDMSLQTVVNYLYLS